MRRLKPSRFPHRKPSRRGLLNIYRALFRHYGHRHWWPGETPFEVIVGAILTQNTAWRNVEKAIRNLKDKNLLTPSALKRIPKTQLAELIRPAGYFNVKSKRLKTFIRFLWQEFHGSLPRMLKLQLTLLRERLLSVNGIGEETADSILLYAAKKRIFVVDAYTKRVFTRHRYLRGNEDYSTIQKIFNRLLPKSLPLYNDYHAQIVEVGKDYCRAVPQCDRCPLRGYL